MMQLGRVVFLVLFFFFKQKTAYEMRISDWSSDVCSSDLAIQRQRATLVSQARGRVLEIGIGTGRNLPFYDRDKLESLQGLDPAAQMHGLARKRARKAGLDVELLTLPAERIDRKSTRLNSSH